MSTILIRPTRGLASLGLRYAGLRCKYVLRSGFRILLFLLVLGCCGLWVPRVAAQGPVEWSEPFSLSNSLTSSIHPAIVTDSYGYVHVFWSEDLDGRVIDADELPDPGNTIMYRRWDGQSWTEPLSILAVSDDSLADYVAAAIDSENRIHLVWTGLARTYYSNALAVEADSVRAWSTPYVISFDNARSRYESDVAVDALSNVHVVYATRGNEVGVFHVMLPFDSTIWTLPNRISDLLRENEVAFMDVRLVVDASDRLHAVWSTANTDGYGQAVYYARNENLGLAWEAPERLADATINTSFTGFPSLLAYGSDALLLIHGSETSKGRVEWTSSDGGVTWNEPYAVIPSMEGVNGFLTPLVDGAGDLHLVINMRPSADQRVGIYYAPRAGLDWAPIAPVAVDAPYGPSAHYTDAVIRLGNEIHVVWTQLRSGEIWYVRGDISGLEPSPAMAVPVLSQSTPTPASVLTAPEPGSTTVSNPAFPEPAPAQTTAPWTPIVAAVVPVVLLVGGILIGRVRRR